MTPKVFQGYIVLLLETTLGKFQFFVTICAHFALPIDACMFGTIYDQAADMIRIEPFSWHYHMDLGFAIHEAALFKHEAIVKIDLKFDAV